MLNRKLGSSREKSEKGETLERDAWNISDRSSSIDSGISELPSSMHSSPSPVLPHSPTGHTHVSSSEGKIHQRPISAPTESRPTSSFSNYNPLPDIGNQESCSRPELLTSQHYHVQKNVLRTNSLVIHPSRPNSGSSSPGRPLSKLNSCTNAPGKAPSRPNSGTNYTGRTPSRPRSSSSDVSNHSRTPRPPSTKKVSTKELRRQQFSRRRSSQTLTSDSVSNEPSEDEPRILLAVKLPNGERFQRYFRPTERFIDIATCAEKRTKCSYSNNCNLFVNQVPKRLISNWKETFHESGLCDRTLLFLEEKDD